MFTVFSVVAEYILRCLKGVVSLFSFMFLVYIFDIVILSSFSCYSLCVKWLVLAFLCRINSRSRLQQVFECVILWDSV